ncbi:MAG: hypothetical protein EAS48_03915 [Chryseobacterium sp.]|nr:MAG: hypothetical protein EAS48_03915 [Chryseobacterium sp.]
MSPTRLFFEGKPGETLTQTVILNNSSTKDYTFTVSYRDWNRDQQGNKHYFDPSTLQNSNSAWISTRERSISVPAGTSRELPVTMKVPENASPADVTNSMLFFTQIPTQEDITNSGQGIGIITLMELGLHVYYTPTANTTKDLEIAAMELRQEPTRRLAVRISNEGNTVTDATVELELTNKETGADVKLQPISISMMPQTTQTVEFAIDKKLSGNFLGVAIIKMEGSTDLRVGEKDLKL